MHATGSRRPGWSARSRSAFRTTGTCGTGGSTAIASVGMFEHVGSSRSAQYFGTMRRLLQPEGRLLNHAISSVGGSRIGPRTFIGRYVFPDGELIDVGQVVLGLEEAGFEVRDVESLREHYARTLRAWVGEPPAALGCSGRRGGRSPGSRVAALHGGIGQRVRRRRDLHPPGAGRGAGPGRPERHAVDAAQLGLKPSWHGPPFRATLNAWSPARQIVVCDGDETGQELLE